MRFAFLLNLAGGFMKNQELIDKVREICTQMAATINFVISLTDKYINSFETEDFFSFSDTEKRLKALKKKYAEFFASLAEPLNKLENDAAEVSTLLIRADIEMNLDMITYLQMLFEEYLQFEKTLAAYGTNVKRVFEEKNISISLLLNEANKFKFSLMALLQKTN